MQQAGIFVKPQETYSYFNVHLGRETASHKCWI